MKRLLTSSCALAILTAAAPAQTPTDSLWATNFSGSIKSVSKLDPVGSVVTSTTISASFTPFGLAVDPLGNLWAGSNGTTVAKLDSAGVVLGTFPVGSFPQSVASDAAGNMWVVNRSSNSVSRLDNLGNSLGTTPLPSGTSPIGVIVDQAGFVWVSGFHASTSTLHTMMVLDSAGTVVNTYSFTSSPGFGFSFPSVDRDNDIWVANQGRSSIMQIDAAGNLLSETPITAGLPRGNQVDGLNYCWLATQGAGACLKIDQAGVVVQTFAPGSFTTCTIDGNGDPWVFGPGGVAKKLWQVDATELTPVTIPSGGTAWGGDSSGFHSAMNLNPTADYDFDGFQNISEIDAGTNPFNANSSPLAPLPIQSGVATPGATIDIGFRFRPDAGLAYVAAAATGSAPGIPLPDGRVVPLTFDPLLLFSLQTPNPLFLGFQGVLDATGDAKGQIILPPDPALSGLGFYVSFVTINPAAPSGIQTVGGAHFVSIQ